MLKLSDKKQNILIYASFIMYMLIYPAKLNYNALMVEILADLGGSKATAGLVGSFFFFAYGVGQVLSGITAKYMNEKYVITLSLFGSAVCNLAMSLATSISIMKYIWLINGIVMSTLWCNVVKTLSKYISNENLPKALTYTGFSMPLGTALNYIICALSVQFAGWEMSFWISTAIMLLTSLSWFAILNNIERSAVALSEKPDENNTENKPENKKGSKIGIGIIVIIGTIFIAGMNAQFVREGINSWVPTILYEVYNIPSTLSIFLTLFIPLLGAFSNIWLVKLENKTKDFLLLTFFFVGLTALFMIILVVCFPLNCFVITFLCFILISTISLNVNGIAINHIPLYYRNKLDSGLLAGVGQGFAYLGSTLSTYTLGYVADNGGWLAAFVMLTVVIIATVLLCIFAKIYVKFKKIG